MITQIFKNDYTDLKNKLRRIRPFFLVVFLILTFNFLLLTCLYCQQGGKFVFSQLKYSDNWDTRPTAWDRISEYLLTTTSVKIIPGRRVLKLSDEILYWSPFIVIAGNTDHPDFTETEIQILKRYILCGGLIFIDDSSGKKGFGFDKNIRDVIRKISPENPLDKIPVSDAVFKSFYLLKNVPGRITTNRYIEGCKIGERYSIIYSQNDLLGAWEKDNLGNYIYPCSEQQRWETKKLMLNIILYSLTGTYKSDTIHKSFIQNKLQ
ncbi:MAG: hypothetical protein A2539_10140 [Elusimicrobia bacterium RIFOXYD2_FULL_34_15]|nr:MAG: hypothetical protein A2539_10140 [Elusimicrobia bacterium RIFOXYD2_FULL_34_15]